MNRRELLQLLAAVPLVSRVEAKPMSASSRMPVTFVAHGAPPLLDEPGWMAELAAWAKRLPKPKAIVVVSAHWEERPASIGATKPVPLIYDFGGFPQRFYELQYRSPGAPEVAARIRTLLGAAKVPFVDEPARGMDHGTYIPLMAMWPKAEVPVLQLSLPSLDPKEVFALGQALAPLRDEGVLLMGSGFLTHNLRGLSGAPKPPAWSSDFDAWVAEGLQRGDVDGLLDFMAKGPAARIALPTTEHYVPMLFGLGASQGEMAKVSFPIDGFWFGMTRRSVQWG